MLARGDVELLSRGGAGNPDVLLFRDGEGFQVVKDFAPRGRWMRLVGPWLIRRELRAYRQLAEHPSVPRVLGEVDSLAFAIEYRPGDILGPAVARRLLPSFVDELRTGVARMHELGVVHLDLRHRSNALADADGRLVLIDFASAICFQPGSLAARWLLPLLAEIDRRAVEKWAGQLKPAARDR
jgi:hypothetical protein